MIVFVNLTGIGTEYCTVFFKIHIQQSNCTVGYENCASSWIMLHAIFKRERLESLRWLSRLRSKNKQPGLVSDNTYHPCWDEVFDIGELSLDTLLMDNQNDTAYNVNQTCGAIPYYWDCSVVSSRSDTAVSSFYTLSLVDRAEERLGKMKRRQYHFSLSSGKLSLIEEFLTLLCLCNLV